MRRQISAESWEQARTAYASGIPLRDLARRMGIPEGSMLAHASRKHWTQRIEAAKSMAKPLESAIVPACDAAAQTMQERSARHVERMARVTDKVLPHLESMEPGEILDSARNLERFDYVARRNYGLEREPNGTCPVNVSILTNRSAIQIISPESVARESSKREAGSCPQPAVRSKDVVDWLVQSIAINGRLRCNRDSA